MHLSSLLAYSNDLKCTTFYHNEYHIIIYTYKYRDATKVCVFLRQCSCKKIYTARPKKRNCIKIHTGAVERLILAYSAHRLDKWSHCGVDVLCQCHNCVTHMHIYTRCLFNLTGMIAFYYASVSRTIYAVSVQIKLTIFILPYWLILKVSFLVKIFKRHFERHFHCNLFYRTGFTSSKGCVLIYAFV